jgi:hypothetical protein
MTDGFPRGFDEHRRRQLLRTARSMTPAQRLRWLEDAKAAFARWCGRARDARR